MQAKMDKLEVAVKKARDSGSSRSLYVCVCVCVCMYVCVHMKKARDTCISRPHALVA